MVDIGFLEYDQEDQKVRVSINFRLEPNAKQV